jgi:uncharacterized protein
LQSIGQGLASALASAINSGDPERAERVAHAFGLLSLASEPRPVPRSVPTRAISLAIAQKCNLGCGYCYAQQGSFGGKARDMDEAVAHGAIDQLLKDAIAGDVITVAFMGGEPLANRRGLHAATHYAANEAEQRGVGVRFAITTNLTLLTDQDIELFDRYRFGITVSIDGLGAVHDDLRPFAGGKGSFARVSANIGRLHAVESRSFQLFARATVTPRNLDLVETLGGLLEMGFDSVMFAPLLSAPAGGGHLAGDDLATMLAQLTRCADLFASHAHEGRLLPLANITRLLKLIKEYRHDQYPCGAGGGYVGVSAGGDYSACHRFVDGADGFLGNVDEGISPKLQEQWLAVRNLAAQTPCTSCWARYLCSGGCHYDAMNAGRLACDYIRGWADVCLRLYQDLHRYHPEVLNLVLRPSHEPDPADGRNG